MTYQEARNGLNQIEHLRGTEIKGETISGFIISPIDTSKLVRFLETVNKSGNFDAAIALLGITDFDIMVVYKSSPQMFLYEPLSSAFPDFKLNQA